MLQCLKDVRCLEIVSIEFGGDITYESCTRDCCIAIKGRLINLRL